MNAQRCRELQRACTLFDHIKHRGPVSARRGPRSAQFGRMIIEDHPNSTAASRFSTRPGTGPKSTPAPSTGISPRCARAWRWPVRSHVDLQPVRAWRLGADLTAGQWGPDEPRFTSGSARAGRCDPSRLRTGREPRRCRLRGRGVCSSDEAWSPTRTARSGMSWRRVEGRRRHQSILVVACTWVMGQGSPTSRGFPRRGSRCPDCRMAPAAGRSRPCRPARHRSRRPSSHARRTA